MNRVKIHTKNALSNREKEVYRMLRTNIEFTGVENRAIAITSCAPNDGKSTVAYNLARAFAEAGKKVVLVDADLRKSVLLKRLRVHQALKGLSHMISGQVKVGEVLHATNISGLYLLPSGIFPSNPTELLGNDRFKQLMLALKHTFDYVIVDTPPIGSVIDAAVIAKNCDGSILVLASDQNSRADAKHMLDQMRSANPNILGVVLNKVNAGYITYMGKAYSEYYAAK